MNIESKTLWLVNPETRNAVADMPGAGWVQSKSPIGDPTVARTDGFENQAESKISPRQIFRRLVSFPAESSVTKHEAILLNIKKGRCYSLNEFAARVWQTIGGTAGGISLEQVVDRLESHFNGTAEDLRGAVSSCVEELLRESLVTKKVDTDEPLFAAAVFSPNEVSVLGFVQQPGQTFIGKQRFIQRLETLESFIDQLFPQGTQNAVDWRANKLKDAIDKAAGKVNRNLGHICTQLELSLSHRQARRVFKEAAGISMKDYARRRRLVFAAKQLQDTGDPLKVIADSAGYDTYDGFRKAFEDMFRLTPVEFRKFWQQRQVSA